MKENVWRLFLPTGGLRSNIAGSGKSFIAQLSEWDGKSIANGSAFNDKGELIRQNRVLTESMVQAIKAIQDESATVVSKKTRGFTEKARHLHHLDLQQR